MEHLEMKKIVLCRLADKPLGEDWIIHRWWKVTSFLKFNSPLRHVLSLNADLTEALFKERKMAIQYKKNLLRKSPDRKARLGATFVLLQKSTGRTFLIGGGPSPRHSSKITRYNALELWKTR
ncbi:hypothetical protein EBR66_04810 [bacterium]|nr:hypothetical protein [bacterium]